jgi:hypothetical protein
MLALLRKSLVVLTPVLLGGCSSEGEFTTDISGNYTVAVTNRTSTCDFKDWVPGKQTSGIGFVVTQEDTSLHATVDGVTAVFFKLALGSAEFDGSVERSSFELTNYGSRAQTQGNCTFSYNATIVGDLVGDAISGSIRYAPATTDSPDCADVSCEAFQDFSGSRPPR